MEQTAMKIIDALTQFRQNLVALRGVFESISNDFNSNSRSKLSIKELTYPNSVSDRQLQQASLMISRSATQFHILFSDGTNQHSTSLDQLREFEQNIIFLISLFSNLVSSKENGLNFYFILLLFSFYYFVYFVFEFK
jgi:hypothetical protein